MTRNNLLEFDAEILSIKRKIKELEPYIDTNQAFAMQYNQLLVQKAILIDKRRKQRRHASKKTFLGKIKRLFTISRKKRTICSYFQEEY